MLFNWRRFLAQGLLVSFLALISTAARADFKQSQAWFESMSADQRADIQGNLVLLAHYGGMVDGEFGANTYGAIVAWQEEMTGNPTGVLTSDQQGLLGQMASEVMSELGMTLVDDQKAHLSIMLPTGVLSEQRVLINGTLYKDAGGQFTAQTFWRDEKEGTLSQLYHKVARPVSGRTISYSILRDHLYVVTGTEGDRFFYELARTDGKATAGFRFVYTEQHKNTGGIASVFAASYSIPISVSEMASLPNSVPATPTTVTPMSVPQPDLSTSGSATDDGVHEFGNFLTFDDAPGVIAMVGDIGPSTPLDFRRALRAVEDPKVIALASDGGLVSSALLVAYEVHERGLATYVTPDSGCYSACAFVFLAGSSRLAEGEVGVHQVWGEQVDASSAQTVVSDILEAFNDFGVRQEVTSAMLRTVPEDMYIFTATELARWGVNSGEVFE